MQMGNSKIQKAKITLKSSLKTKSSLKIKIKHWIKYLTLWASLNLRMKVSSRKSIFRIRCWIKSMMTLNKTLEKWSNLTASLKPCWLRSVSANFGSSL